MPVGSLISIMDEEIVLLAKNIVHIVSILYKQGVKTEGILYSSLYRLEWFPRLRILTGPLFSGLQRILLHD